MRNQINRVEENIISNIDSVDYYKIENIIMDVFGYNSGNIDIEEECKEALENFWGYYPLDEIKSDLNDIMSKLDSIDSSIYDLKD